MPCSAHVVYSSGRQPLDPMNHQLVTPGLELSREVGAMAEVGEVQEGPLS